MKRALLAAVVVLFVPSVAFADDPYALGASAAAPARQTWGAHGGAPDASSATSATSSSRRDSPVTKAREMLTRARTLDEAAALDEKNATELAAKLPGLRLEAKAARDRADRATGDQRELLGAKAEDLETDVQISDAEVAFKRKIATENRQLAHELRLRAVKVLREEPTPTAIYDPTGSSCDPPFRYTQDGRKVYRVECLK
jgi:hypothetical protein